MVHRGHNRENHTYIVFILKREIFSRTRRPMLIKLSTNHPLVKGILNYANKGPIPLQREIITKIQKKGVAI
jgi:hypothetical protein